MAWNGMARHGHCRAGWESEWETDLLHFVVFSGRSADRRCWTAGEGAVVDGLRPRDGVYILIVLCSQGVLSVYGRDLCLTQMHIVLGEREDVLRRMNRGTGVGPGWTDSDNSNDTDNNGDSDNDTDRGRVPGPS